MIFADSNPLRPVIFCFLFLFGGQLNAAPIPVSGSEALQYSPANILTETNLAAATDGNLSTGYFVQTSRDPAQPTTGLGGLEIRWDFDVSDFTSVSQFVFNFSGILNDPSSIDSVQFSSIGTTTQPSQNANIFTVLAMPDGDTVSTSIVLSEGGTPAREDVNAFISGGILSMYVSTRFGFSSPQSISLTTLEVSADIIGNRVVSTVPEPSIIFLLMAGLAGLGFTQKRN